MYVHSSLTLFVCAIVIYVCVTSFVALNLDWLLEISWIAESKLVGGAYAHVIDLVVGHVVELALSDIWRQVGEVFPHRLAGVSFLDDIVE